MLYVVRRVSCELEDDLGPDSHLLRSHLVALGLPMMLSLAQQVLGDVLPPMGGDFPPSTPSPPKYPPGTTCAPDASGVVDHVNCCTVTVPSGGASPFCTDNPSATTDGASVFLPVGEQCTAACGTEKESSFNLIGACSSGSDVPPSDIPATCESACGAGKTCSQVGELEENECRRMGFSGPETYGNSWKRRCTERTSAALVASPSTAAHLHEQQRRRGAHAARRQRGIRVRRGGEPGRRQRRPAPRRERRRRTRRRLVRGDRGAAALTAECVLRCVPS